MSDTELMKKLLDGTLDPTELDNMGGDTNGKGFECNMFEITRPDNE